MWLKGSTSSVQLPYRRPSQVESVLSSSNSHMASPNGALGQALDTMSGPSKAEAAAFVSNHSPDPQDLLPGLCLLTERWLERVRVISALSLWHAVLAAVAEPFAHILQCWYRCCPACVINPSSTSLYSCMHQLPVGQSMSFITHTASCQRPRPLPLRYSSLCRLHSSRSDRLTMPAMHLWSITFRYSACITPSGKM